MNFVRRMADAHLCMNGFISSVKGFTMPRLTITITEEQADLLDEKTGDEGAYESKSEAVREFIQRGDQLIQRVEELENENEQLRRQITTLNDRLEKHSDLEDEHFELKEEYEALETRRNELQRQLAAVNSRQEDVTELVEYIEQQRDLERYRARREQMVDQAGLLTRWKWKLTGVPVNKDRDK